ncbi:hypothetical protein [Streptomyces albicerus]|uniref:hypothetical protein n=1 Tax=Streptomyces albicerus TaxID=2569859 RepID=UPI001788DB5D|nr:hypothetical protein [Streptomyces albicerus]
MTTPSRTPDADPMRTWLTRLSLAAGIAFTAHAEYALARTLGADPFIAAMLPVSIDAYVVAALRWFRALDIMLSLSLMSAAQVAAHALDARVIAVSFELVVVVSLLVPVALWRTHALARGEETVTAPPVAYAPVPVVTRPSPTPFVWDDYVRSGVTAKVTTSLPAATPRQVVTEVVTLTPAELRKRALKLNREVVTETGRPVTIDRLRDELGLSRRDAAELRREIVEGKRS